MDVDRYHPCQIEPVDEAAVLQASVPGYDTFCVIDYESAPKFVVHKIDELSKFDAAVTSVVSCFGCQTGKEAVRVVYSPVGELNDFDDVRRYAEAAAQALRRALSAGSKQPVLVLPGRTARFKHAPLVALLGALHELYVPLQLREDVPTKSHRIRKLGICCPADTQLAGEVVRTVYALEAGRFVARDIGGGDPERMAPPRVAEYVQQAFASGRVKVTIVDDPTRFEREYPLFQAVNRAAETVQRHRGRIIFLEYQPPKPARKTLILVGKGVTYDTGGADIKAGGIMAGMSRDKCGAAAVAGFMKVIEQRQPADVHAIGVLCMVRNSVGEECYVSDEMLTSRAGVRVRVGNTDAEGRMAMADALCQMKERVLAERLPDPHLYTIATLTGHAVLAVGNSAIVMDNGPARAAGHALELQQAGEDVGDPFEVSVLRREDFNFHKGKCYGEDVLQANNLPSSRTPRGHQGPAAFLMMATGLDKCGLNSSQPIKYSHLDIAGSAGDVPDTPTGSPILALVRTHLN
ncbi:putative aminopeptidase W07G4.4 [Anopheles nili]|uniref:putative aminopeptidase W07G4.4 n=1 Tax=Anopheles nili TaxID=185578 RepID=UPI00237BFEE6|nr:putative aminopeptidase W07G4.4 [Anopheles nili]